MWLNSCRCATTSLLVASVLTVSNRPRCYYCRKGRRNDFVWLPAFSTHPASEAGCLEAVESKRANLWDLIYRHAKDQSACNTVLVGDNSMNLTCVISSSMVKPNGSDQVENGPEHHGISGGDGWTPARSREYNQLIQQQISVGANGGDASSVGSLGSIPMQPGEMVLESYERPTSAPPPPGFVGPDVEDRNRRAEEAIFGGMTLTSSSAHSHHAHRTPVAVVPQHRDGPATTGSGDDDGFSGVTGDSDSAERGFSLTNIMDALGTGLADSMEEYGQQNADLMLRQRLADNPNLHRQTRHAASRLIGGSTSAKTGPPPGSVSAFGSSNHGPGGFHDESRLFGNAAVGNSQSKPSGVPHEDRGFPSSLSSPNRAPGADADGMVLARREESVRRSTTPVQILPGQNRGQQPYAKGIGIHVDEPTDGESQLSGSRISSGVVSKRVDEGPPSAAASAYNQGAVNNELYGADPVGGPPSTLNSQSKEFRPGSHFNDANDGTSTLSAPIDSNTDTSPHQCEVELDSYLWGVGGSAPSSRTIAILHASWLKPPEVRSECEKYGALESFRAEFAPKGIYFASFYDIRSAELAAGELQARLQRIIMNYGSSEDILVRYCLPLNSSSQFDESQILINGLSDEITESALTNMLRSFGAIRACISQGPGSYLVEFQNVQDAKQATLELESSLPWGPDATVEVSPRKAMDRRRGRELLSMINRWRHAMGRPGPSNGSHAPAGGGTEGPRHSAPPPYALNDFRGRDPVSSGPAQQPPMAQHEPYNYGGYSGGGGGRQPETVTQLIMGPDGRYTPVVVQNTLGIPSHGAPYGVDPRSGQQQIIHGADGHIYISSAPSPHVYGTQGGYHHPPTIVAGSPYVDGARRPVGATPYYTHSIVSDNISVHSGRSHGTHGTHGTQVSHHSAGEEKDNRHLMLELDAVESGRDTRTSLMVRNIPNKYTQQMLLAEFTENGHGPGVIDFFYLPIDFKNRCNRGYAFINFVNYQDILAFHRRYFGKQWRTFNSDKICDITYARIQGKAAMLKRFENSALMDKDDEYKPLVFVSHGPEKGKRLPFADPHNKPV